MSVVDFQRRNIAKMVSINWLIRETRKSWRSMCPFFYFSPRQCLWKHYTTKSKSNIWVGFADVTRTSGVNLAHVTQMLRAKFAYDVHHVARVHQANVARNCHARSAQQGMLLLDPSVKKQVSICFCPRYSRHVNDDTWNIADLICCQLNQSMLGRWWRKLLQLQ
jgi:hypothetical protein